jgi:hypothetical protein
MYPEIREFWTKVGEVDSTLSAPIVYYMIQLYSSGKYFSIAERDIDAQPNITKYFYNGETYTESEMLKIIKLKAFI